MKRIEDINNVKTENDLNRESCRLLAKDVWVSNDSVKAERIIMT